MPGRDGTGPAWGGGPGSGRGRGVCKGRGFSGSRGSRNGNTEKNIAGNASTERASRSESMIALIGGIVALATSVVKLFSDRKQSSEDSGSVK